ncbi:hypothetical protein P8452_17232 [Trifolium repens]|nr:hypothetical protein P8452_17232 [Trifolium repens]
MWWKADDNNVDYKLLRVDKDACVVSNYAMNNNGKVQLYIEHDVDDVSCLVDEPNYFCAEELVADDYGEDVGRVNDTENDKGKGVMVESDHGEAVDYSSVDDSSVDGSSSEDDAKGITFDDSEDERALGCDDGFGLPHAAPMNG